MGLLPVCALTGGGLGLLAALIALAVWLNYVSWKKRCETWRQFARRRGLTLADRFDTRAELGDFATSPSRTFPHRRYASHAAEGEVDDRAVVVLEYWSGNGEDRIHVLAAGCEVSDLDLPRFRVESKASVTALFTIRLWTPPDEFELGDRAFDRVFRVAGRQREDVRDLLDRRVVRLLARRAERWHLSVACNGRYLVVYITATRQSEEMDAVLDVALELVELFEDE